MSAPFEVQVLDKSSQDLASRDQITSLIFERRRITVAELIRARVLAEIEKFEQTKGQRHYLVDLTEDEQRLNSLKIENNPDFCEQQVTRALNLFENNGYFIFIGEQQMTKLEDKITLSEDTSVEFIRLTPLVGG